MKRFICIALLMLAFNLLKAEEAMAQVFEDACACEEEGENCPCTAQDARA